MDIPVIFNTAGTSLKNKIKYQPPERAKRKSNIMIDKKQEGNIFFIPLFLPAKEVKDNLNNYAKYKFTKENLYAFGRLIEIDNSGGDLVEIFNYTGNIPEADSEIIKSGLMFNPIHISLAFSKNRWQFVFERKNYNKNTDSNYQNISFLLGTPEQPQLWKGGKKMSIGFYDTNKYEEWIVYPPTKIENLINQCAKK